MPIGAWSFVQTDVGQVPTTELVDPVRGTGSLFMDKAGAAGAELVMTGVRDLAAERGFTKGKFRSKFRGRATSSNASFHWTGILFMMSQNDVTDGAGTCYAFGVQTTLTPLRFSAIRLMKYTAGIVTPDTVPAQQLDAVNLNPTISIAATEDVFTLEVEWNYDPVELGGVNIVCRLGRTDDFDDLAEFFNVTDTSSPYTTSVGEGFFVLHRGTGNLDTNLDDTTTVQLF